MKKSLTMVAILLSAATVLNVCKTAETLDTLEHGVIRLHVRAASDSTADQTAKLLVRDAVLAHTGEFLPEGGDYAESCAALTAHLPEIQSVAAETLAEAGVSQEVAVALREEPFPERSYGSFTLPAGEYRALCIDIGSGEGQNWWCVMYPSLCLPAAQAEDVLTERFDRDVCDLVTQPEKYEIRLKCVDLWRAVMKKLRND